MEETELKVFGMMCANCALAIEKGVARVAGVTGVTVNLASEEATVTYDESKIDLNRILAAIKKIGYDAKPKDDFDAIRLTESREAKKVVRRLIVGAACSLPVVTVSMIGMFNESFGHTIMHTPWIGWALFLLTTPVVVYTGGRYFVNAAKQALKLASGMDTLVALGSGAAYVYATLTLLGVVPVTHYAYEAAASVITLVTLGKYFEARAKRRAQNDLRSLFDVQGKFAVAIKDGVETEVPRDSIAVGDELIARHGDAIAVDGVIIEGSAAVDESTLTGESVPVHKTVGADVYAGTTNVEGYIVYRATRVGKDSAYSQILQAVDRALAKKPRIQQRVDKVAAIFVPSIIAIAIVTLVVWILLGDVDRAIINMVAALVVACPCAMGLATPTALMVASGLAAKHGVIIKDLDALQSISNVDVFAFDKTGTVTVGRPVVIDAKIDADAALVYRVLFALEAKSSHPIAKAIREYAESHGAATIAVEGFAERAGLGVEGVIDGEHYFLGNERFIESRLTPAIPFPYTKGTTVAFLARENKIIATLSLEDEIRPNAKSTIESLKHTGAAAILVTGDAERAAERVGSALGFDAVVAHAFPLEKGAVIERYQREGKKVLFVGDGINDAYALSIANVGVASASGLSGSDAAKNVAAITLIGGDIGKLVYVRELGRVTLRTIATNLVWAFGYNAIGIPLAALGVLPPMFAGLAMALSSVSVVLNSLALRRRVRLRGYNRRRYTK